MKSLRYYLSELCGISLYCDFRFIGIAAPLFPETTWKWYDLVCDLINFARANDKYIPLEIQLTQAPCLFSVSIYAGNNRFGRYLNEYPMDILIRLTMLGLVSSDIQILDFEGGSGIMIIAC